MERKALNTLSAWLTQSGRMPMVLRGARQVGKTYLVRQLAAKHQLKLIEFNFEKNPEYFQLFADNDVKKLIKTLELREGKPIDIHRTLLFLDEIQQAPALLAKLRWFKEDLPELAVIATGSLLDFMLQNYQLSMPVGRISYCYLEPLSFEEFLTATGFDMLVDFLASYTLKEAMPVTIHHRLLELLRQYFLVGGMPAAIAEWINQHSLLDVSAIQQNLLGAYRDDFNKYPSRIEKGRLEEAFISIPRQLGKKFVYKHVNQDIQSVQIRNALNLLTSARICHYVYNTDAQGIPLGAGVNSKYFKIVLLDIGLANALLRLHLDYIEPNFQLMNEGGMAEQFVGQMLRTLNRFYMDPELYYWAREEKTSHAEIDYIIQHGGQLIPIEVKSGKTGTLKSLHLLMGLRQWPMAVRFNTDLPSITAVNIETSLKQTANYQLLSLPLYLIGQLHRLIEESSNHV